MKKQISEKMKQQITDKYNISLVIRNVERLELAIKRIRSQINSGYLDNKKISNIDNILQSVEKFI